MGSWLAGGPDAGALTHTPGDALEPLADAQGDLGRVSRDRADGIGSDSHGLVIGERGGVDDTSGSQVGSERLEGDASRQARSASKDLDES
jgi:hypothetical protein